MTLHSAASCFPDTPTPTEQQLMQSWLDMFQSTITCPSCREHFEIALKLYRSHYPSMVNSRRDFMLFTFRVHNSVNRRISKPVYPTVEACFEALRTNVKTRSAREYRSAYLSHITRYWRTMQDISGMIANKKLIEMRKIEAEYFQRRDNNFEKIIDEDIVILPTTVLTPSEAGVPQPVRVDQRVLPRAGFSGGRFTFRR